MQTSFFFKSKEGVMVNKRMSTDLPGRVALIREGYCRYFSREWFRMPDWHTHPHTGYRFPAAAHWTQIEDFSTEAGDIKYIWEKSRFTVLYDLVRYDYHYGVDQSALAVRLIIDWIDCNPVNCGPNWKCSQEIALRVLNWTFALHYFRTAPALTEANLNRILCSIYDQMKHVDSNMLFSRIALRNNHTLTEALALFATGLLFPFFPESRIWLRKGKRIFEEEIALQVAADGTYVQHSTNYHRVMMQLLAWALRLGELNNERLSAATYERAEAACAFVRVCMDEQCGWLPNYGHNDGALFFPLGDEIFRDYRPQWSALSAVLGHKMDGSLREEAEWIAGRNLPRVYTRPPADGISVFPEGGYYIIRDQGTLTFLRCAIYRSRPFQCDELHLDLWVSGRNILRDAGTWLYNAGDECTCPLWGTRGHNTVMVGDTDQMQKRGRFIWTHWVTTAGASVEERPGEYRIEAAFEGFKQLGDGIEHRRRVVKQAGKLHWVIEDMISNVPKGNPIRQFWHPDETFGRDFKMTAWDENGAALPLIVETGWYSECYGQRAACDVWVFETEGSYVKTIIEAIE